jgi:hypothetical protein
MINFDFGKIKPKLFVEALLFGILLLVTIGVRIGGGNEYGFDEAFTMIPCDEVDHAPFHPWLPFLAEEEIPSIERLVILGGEEARRPPAFKPLKDIPFLFPECFEEEQKYDLLHWAFIRF